MPIIFASRVLCPRATLPEPESLFAKLEVPNEQFKDPDPFDDKAPLPKAQLKPPVETFNVLIP